jgi:hypothetical protein
MKAPGSATDALGRSISPQGLPSTPPCPFCEGTATELQSAFGSQLSVATFWCRDCRSPFEFMKWGGLPPRPSPPSCEEGGTDPGREERTGEG